MGLKNCLIDHCLLMGGHARLERCRPLERHAAECPIFLQVRVGRLRSLCLFISSSGSSTFKKEDITFLKLNLAVRGKSDPMHTPTVPRNLVAYTMRCPYTLRGTD